MGTDDVTDGQAKAYYLNNPELFRTRDRMEVEYYFSPYLDGLDGIYRLARTGVDFRALKGEVDASRELDEKAPHAASPGESLKQATLYRGAPSLPGVKEDPFRYGVGDVALFRTDTGSYLVHVLNIVPGEVPEFNAGIAEKVKSLSVGKMGYSTSEVGDLVAEAL